MKIKIDKGIKPRETRGRWRDLTPWGEAARTLKVGESFLVNTLGQAETVRGIIEKRGLNFHREQEINGIRVFVLSKSLNEMKKTGEVLNETEQPNKGKLGLAKGKD